MATADLILLRLPWGLIGLSKTRLDIPVPRDGLDAGGCIAPLLFSRDDKPVLLGGDDRLPELFAEFRTRLDETQRVWDIPVPLHGSESQSLRFHSWEREATFAWPHGIDRPPTTRSGEEDEEDQEEPGTRVYRFLRTLRARMQDFETVLSDGLDPWDHVPELWLDPQIPRDPTMDILVQHAREHRATWGDIAEHPRRLLNRRRELVALSRVQELDVQCMQWLSRQPGETLAERAGGRQRIMAFARYENRNILENRIFLDLMARSVAAARDYLAMNQGRTGRTHSPRRLRLQWVEAYMRECRRIEVDMARQGVLRQADPVPPNYVLLYDQRYRRVWTARQEIIRRERAMDDLWRWQRRSWAEFCKVTVAASLIWLDGVERCFASPLFVPREHHRGHWLVHDDPMIVVANWERGWVVELLSGNSCDVSEKHRELCASFWLRCADLDGGDYTYIPVWTVHGTGEESDLRGLVASANMAFRMLRDRDRLGGGVVLVSQVDPSANTRTERAEFVSGCAFGPHDNQLPEALDLLGKQLLGRHIESSIQD